MKKVKDIEEEFKSCSIDALKDLLKAYANDERSGVMQIVRKNSQRLKNYFAELNRLKEISVYENHYFDMGLKFVAGVDEVGRGPLAGPVVACCVVFRKGLVIEGVNDSKKLSEKRRNEVFWEIEKNAVDIGLGAVDEKVIDEVNILEATKMAMLKAIDNLREKPDMLLIDALKLEGTQIPQEAIIKGDEKCVSIGAASIVAKVMRDEMMYKFAREYPEYAFDKNKGYGSKEHMDALRKYGPTPIHRRTFIKNIIYTKVR